MCCATPSEPPASPAAGWIHRSSKMPSRRILPFATQLSATPPAMQSFDMPVASRTWRAMRSTISSVTTWIDAARSMSLWVSGDSGARAGRPKSCSKRRPVMRRPWQYVKYSIARRNEPSSRQSTSFSRMRSA